jgi:excisionase family DNA binding protein
MVTPDTPVKPDDPLAVIPTARRASEATPTPGSTPRVLLRVEEAAERLAISRTLIFAYLKSGAIESVKVGRLRRIPADALAAFVTRLTNDQAVAAA